MRSQQDMETKFSGAVESTFEQQNIAARVRGDAEPQRITRMLVQDLDRRHSGRQQAKCVVGVALDLRPEAVRPGHDKAEGPDPRDVDAGIVNLVDDAEAHREPQPRRAKRAADKIFGANRPGGGNARLAGGMAGSLGKEPHSHPVLSYVDVGTGTRSLAD